MLNILRTFQLGFHRFFSLYLCSVWNRRDATRAPPELHKTPPTREKAAAAQQPCRSLRPVRRLFTQDAAEPRWSSHHGPGADITTKALMTPHFSFVHRNESWNSSFILHYWQRTILTRTLVVCSNASISGHCLSSEMKTAL